MKRIEFVWSLALSAGLVWAAGCASEPAKPAPQPTVRHEEPTAPAAAAAAETKITLPPGAAQPPAPFEGEGWQAMFDGQSLAGWREDPVCGPRGSALPGRRDRPEHGRPVHRGQLDERIPQDELRGGARCDAGDGLGLLLRADGAGRGLVLQSDRRRLGRLAGRHLQPGRHGRVGERDDQVRDRSSQAAGIASGCG